MTILVETGIAHEAREFAETVAAVVARHASEDPWRPGVAASDADVALDRALSEAGWDELGRDPDLLAFAGPAAEALGRGLASLAPVDRLLGGALRVDSLVRYPAEGMPLVEPRAGRLEIAAAERLRPVPYTDALGMAHVDAAAGDGEVTGDEAHRRITAWAAASTGYLAGLAGRGLDLAVEHARSRRAFGGTLAALEPVQQMLADAATLTDGLCLLTDDRPALDALAHAGEAAERITAICMQVTGALGFTLEFPLQRAYRRSRAARAWADAVLLAWEGPPR